ncbi:acetyl-CoA carboxylase biotin carboxyl carrier protein subunit [Nesterenkonia pannonica]|uniref:acetyl-CoA carboxylase biotin carboxyl carrier protein subunit n=1 Tax=Nesterenkonia pannonica TaxID=1548602 RepID=UPI002164B9CA|nr:acetyl-CoA carboxylase biotin carboxyl carrier protein subunit [Nesterenkonia pannonica]
MTGRAPPTPSSTYERHNHHGRDRLPSPASSTRRPDRTSPFVSPGDTVEAGQAVGLVEVMKQFTEIKSDVSGTVASVDSESGATVVPGTVLVTVDEG